MNITKYISELRAEGEAIAEAVAVLQRLTIGKPRRGRPPSYIGSAAPQVKRVFSLETRKRMAAAQRKRWAKR